MRGIQKQESMEPQRRHTDIHKEEMTKTQLSLETRFGTGLFENTPPLGDCPTEAPWRSTAARHCFDAPHQWTRAGVGNLGQRPAGHDSTLLWRRTIRTHSRNIHQDEDDTWFHTLKQTETSCSCSSCHFMMTGSAENEQWVIQNWNAVKSRNCP